MQVQVQPHARGQRVALPVKRALLLLSGLERLLLLGPARRLLNIIGGARDELLDLIESLLDRVGPPGFGEGKPRALKRAPVRLALAPLLLSAALLRPKRTQNPRRCSEKNRKNRR